MKTPSTGISRDLNEHHCPPGHVAGSYQGCNTMKWESQRLYCTERTWDPDLVTRSLCGRDLEQPPVPRVVDMESAQQLLSIQESTPSRCLQDAPHTLQTSEAWTEWLQMAATGKPICFLYKISKAARGKAARRERLCAQRPS